MPEDNQALNWRKSSRSGADNCVLIATTDAYAYVRDSKVPDGPILAFDAATWRQFLHDVGNGAFDFEQEPR